MRRTARTRGPATGSAAVPPRGSVPPGLPRPGPRWQRVVLAVCL